MLSASTSCATGRRTAVRCGRGASRRGRALCSTITPHRARAEEPACYLSDCTNPCLGAHGGASRGGRQARRQRGQHLARELLLVRMVVLVSVAIIVAYIWSVLQLARMSRSPRVDPARSAGASPAVDRSADVPTGRRATSLPPPNAPRMGHRLQEALS